MPNNLSPRPGLHSIPGSYPPGGSDDPFTNPGGEERVHLRIRTVATVTPLDAQFGVLPKRCVPTELREPLFSSGTGSADAEIYCYAIIDAAKYPNLPDLLIQSGLEHRCLLKGDAQKELGDVAPWVVKLDADNQFTRKLFTQGDAAWNLWDRQLGIFLRSEAMLNEIWAHFRKFLRVRDESGAWFYVRFWQPEVMSDYLSKISDDHERLVQWGVFRSGRILSDIVTYDAKKNAAIIYSFHFPAQIRPSNRAFFLDERERYVFKNYKIKLFLYKLKKFLEGENQAFAHLSDEVKKIRCTELAVSAAIGGLTIEKAVADFALAEILSGGEIRRDPICQKLISGSEHQLDRASTILAEARSRLLVREERG